MEERDAFSTLDRATNSLGGIFQTFFGNKEQPRPQAPAAAPKQDWTKPALIVGGALVAIVVLGLVFKRGK